MGSLIYYAVLFLAKVLDNALSTTKTILIQRSRWLLAGIAVVLSDFIYFWLTKRIVSGDNNWAILIVSLAGGVGCALACLFSEKLSKDRTYVNVIMSDNLEAMQNFRDFLAAHHITNVAADTYTLDWSKKTISITAYPETKEQSRLITEYTEHSPLKFKRVVQKTYDVVNKTKEYCEGQEIEFLRAKSKLAPQQTWKVFGPPAVTIRWCCSVHKTTPQITLLRDILDKRDFTGMAFTGIRGDESASRNEYDGISYGGKHTGQYSCHPILEWNTAELFLYIYQNNLILNEAYKKGNTRAGCLVCPMSQGKHDFMKHQSYPDETNAYIECIASTSGKKHYSPNELTHFVESGYWRTRKSGRELNFGQDLHTFELVDGKNVITIFNKNIRWKEWVKTIGPLTLFDDNRYCIEYENHQYFFRIKDMPDGGEQFIFQSFGNGKDDVKFISLFKSSIIKSVYCINCGYCAAECKKGCIDMANGLKISSDCEHCHSCHDIYSHCLRYNSIKNRIGAKSMTGLDRYYSFGVKENWLRVYFDYEGSANFWNTDGDGEIPNKKKDAFLNFVKDAGMVYEDKTLKGKESKYIRFKPNSFAEKMFSLGIDSESMWAYLMCNLVYASDAEEFRWFIKNIPFNESVTLDAITYRLEEIMENDKSGLGKRNVRDALKVFILKTPFGSKLGLGKIADYDEKISANGKETISLNYFVRGAWENPDEKVILYALYKFAEACGNYKQFTLTRLLDTSIESEGISPTQIFGLNRDTMEKILNGLTFNYPDLIEARFTLGLDNITLKSDKSAEEILNELF